VLCHRGAVGLAVTLPKALAEMKHAAPSGLPPAPCATLLPATPAWLGGNNRARDGCWLVLVVVEVSCTCESAREILTAGAEGHTDSSLEKAGGRSNPGTRPWIPKVVQQEKATWLRAL
jgi:hypothetical protein